jgi:uncharacterized protein (TIGR02246 family)
MRSTPLPIRLFFCVSLIGAAAVGQEARHADHEALRAMLRTATAALNNRNFAALAPMFTADCSITTVDGKAIRGPAAFRSYLDQLYASRVKSIAFHPVADDLTTFYGEDAGVCAGASSDTYTFRDGDSRTMSSRWTAAVHKEGGVWKVAALHMSANVLDNPVVQATRQRAITYAVAALIAGLIVGFILRMLIK